jgi:uncharacterized protein YbjQ (UPF0145 family)
MSPQPSAPARFASNLTVDEFLLVTEAGWDSVAVVGGDCSYNTGTQGTLGSRRGELNRISESLAAGQSRALERMRDEATEAGSEGVVSVRLERAEIEPGENANVLVEHFTAIGSAVRRRNSAPPKNRAPFTSHLSGQDTWALLDAGYMPLGVVFGFSVYHFKRVYRRLRACCEMPEITDAVYGAREHAMSRMQGQAAHLGATGIVGVSIDMKHSRRRTIIFTALGTAIAKPKPHPESREPRTALTLNTRSSLPVPPRHLTRHGQQLSGETP